jgi:uncharacterized membrane protein YgcG
MATYGIPTKAIHEQWLGLVQPVGLVVAPAVLTKLELVPNQSTAYISALQLQLKGLLEKFDGLNGDPVMVVSSFQQLATELLDWGEADLQGVEALVADRAPEGVPEVVLSEYGETLRPTHGVPKLEGEGLQALVLDLTQWRDASGTLTPQWGRDLDAPWNPSGNGWDATPQQRFERLLKETEHPIGLLFNGTQLRLVHAPRGESSGWLTLPLEPMAEVAGRPMLGALELLLGVDRLFGGNPEQRLPAVLAASRKNQNEVSTRLAEQVLEALWELLLGFDAAERLAQQAGRTVLGALPTTEEGQKHLYGGLITVLLRLVFLLYAEDEALMPADSLYGQHYSVSALADRLRQERFEHQSGMAERRGGWASLLSLFRLVYDGGGADPNYLPARHGELFDPDSYPFLEGRGADSAYVDCILDNLPALSDDVVEKVLSKLIWLDGERLSYRALDVEQIGSVYEGIMGFTVEQAQGPSVGITYRPSRQKITITVVVDAEQLLAVSPAKREKWLDDQTGVTLKLPAGVKKDLKDATTLTELCVALDKKLSTHTPNTLPAGSLILQPTAERRRSGSHYTPRALTEPIVAEAFRPWLERCKHKPTAEQILALKVCDPAMGSGAFLVAVCRFLAGWLVEAWERDGYPDDFREEWDKDIVARRRIAQSCLYGVDKNAFAVNLAKLSLWLVTLSKELPFTFVDHALKCGDSLVGYSVKEIRAAMSEVQLGFLDAQNRIYEQMGIDRRESFAFDSLTDTDYDNKKMLLKSQIEASDGLRQAGDLMVAAFFNAAKTSGRTDKQQIYLAMLSGAASDRGLLEEVREKRRLLAEGEQGIIPFHWDLEFPEVFGVDPKGFDVVIGNPPFAGHSNLGSSFHPMYTEFLRDRYEGTSGKCDICAYFFRKSFDVLKDSGSLNLLATNTIAQGDTRTSALQWICNNNGTIYSACRRMKWPGVASVVVSTIAILKNARACYFALNGEKVQKITSFLLDKGDNSDPKALASNKGFTFQGSIILGKGFIIEDSEKADTESPDTPIPPDHITELLRENPNYIAIIKDYLGGEDLNSHPVHRSSRRVIDLGDLSELEANECYPEVMDLLRSKVMPSRMKSAAKSNTSHGKRCKVWWQHYHQARDLYESIRSFDQVFAISCRAVVNLSVARISTNQIFDQSLVIFKDKSLSHFAVVSSRLHEIWLRCMCSSIGDIERYNPSDCYINFAFPRGIGPGSSMSENPKAHERLDNVGNELLEFRASLLTAHNIGLTPLYNAFNDPGILEQDIISLRASHDYLDREVLKAYDWADIDNTCGFGLDYVDTEDDIQLPDELQERIDSGDLFFWDANDALDFQGQLQAYGAITGRRKLPWRYRWPDSVRDDVLARLLALNAERHQEEVDQGLHGGGRGRGGGGSSGGSGPGRRRGRPPKTPAPDSGQTAQIGLAL